MPANLQNLSKAYQQMGSLKEAEQTALRAVDVARSVYGEDHPASAWARSTLAVAYGADGRWEEGTANLLEALKIMTETYGADHDYTSGTRGTLSFFYIKAARYEEAAEQMKISELAMNESLPATSHAFADHWFNWGGLYKLTERYPLALENFEKSRQIYTELYGPDDRWTADALLEIAEVKRLMGEYEAAADYYDRGLDILLTLWDDDHPAIMKYSRSYLMSLKAIGSDAEAAVIETRIERAERQQAGASES